MNALPTRIGALELIRRLGSDGGTESYEGRRADGDRGRVFVRRVLPSALTDPGAHEAIETRVRDLMGVRHPFLVPVLDVVSANGELLIVEQWADAVSTARIIAWCRQHQVSVPHNVFLNLSTQICNGIEALHGRPGKATGSPNVLHMALRPSALFVNLDGRILLGGYGLARPPSLLPGPLEQGLSPVRAAYLSPEQAEADQKLIPASDIFSLAAVLYELLTLEPLFSAETTAAVLQRLHRAEITTQLLGIKDLMPGLDKVLYRALSSSPRHRYQRAFVLREDLRGLMAGYSFASIAEDTRRFLEPIAQEAAAAEPPPQAAPGPDSDFEDAEGKASTRIDPDPTSTAAFASQALAERILREQRSEPRSERPAAPTPAPMPQSFPSPRGSAPSNAPNNTGAWVAQAQGKPIAPAPSPYHPTLAPPEPSPVPPAPRVAPPPAVAPPPLAAPTPVSQAFGASPTASALPLPDAQPYRPQIQPQTAVDLPLAPKPLAPAPVSRSDALAATAPPPGRSDAIAASAPPPRRAPTPVAAPIGRPTPPSVTDAAGSPLHGAPAPVRDPEEDTGDWEPPKRRGGLMFALVVGGLVLVLVCSGSLWVAWRYFASSLIGVPEDIAAYQVPENLPAVPDAPEPPIADAGLDAVAAVEPGEEAPPAVEPAVEPAVASPVPAAVQPDSARDRPAYAAPSHSSPSATSAGAASSHGSSATSAGRSSSGAGRSSAVPSSQAASSSYGTSSGRSSSPGSGGSSSSSSRSSSSQPSAGSQASSSGRSSSGTRASPPADTPTPPTDDARADASNTRRSPADDSNALLERYSASAANGGLSSSDIMVVEMVQPEDPAYTRSRLLLAMNAKKKGDAEAIKRYLDELSLRPENQYNPVVLAEYARYYVNKQDYQRALDKAVLAERHWARLPPELVFQKKAEIYEVEASAYQGLFYRSEDNIELLDKSIRQWKKYREHVMTESRTDLQTHATREIEKLENIRERLQ